MTEQSKPRSWAQFGRSLVTSLFTTVLDFGTLIGLTELAGVNYVVSTWIGTVVGSLSNFAINKRWAFSARSAALGPALGRFVLVQGGASGLHTVGVWALTRFGRVPYPVSKLVVAAAVYLVWNYPLNRWFVFRRPGLGPVRIPAPP
jgi:putative flippase GtrA